MPPQFVHRWRRFRAFNACTIALGERFLRAQRPWEQDWLHWVQDTDGWHLRGNRLPPARMTHRRGQ